MSTINEIEPNEDVEFKSKFKTHYDIPVCFDCNKSIQISVQGFDTDNLHLRCDNCSTIINGQEQYLTDIKQSHNKDMNHHTSDQNVQNVIEIEKEENTNLDLINEKISEISLENDNLNSCCGNETNNNKFKQNKIVEQQVKINKLNEDIKYHENIDKSCRICYEESKSTEQIKVDCKCLGSLQQMCKFCFLKVKEKYDKCDICKTNWIMQKKRSKFYQNNNFNNQMMGMEPDFEGFTINNNIFGGNNNINGINGQSLTQLDINLDALYYISQKGKRFHKSTCSFLKSTSYSRKIAQMPFNKRPCYQCCNELVNQQTWNFNFNDNFI